MDVLLSWERLLWSCRGLLQPRERYMLTDVRLVRIAGRNSDEIALEDIGDVQRRVIWIDRVFRTSTLIVHSKRGRRPPLVLRHVRKGAQLAALLEFVSGEPRKTWSPESVQAMLAWEPRIDRQYGEAVVGLAAVTVAVFAVAISLHGTTSTVSFSADDAIYPSGVKRDPADINRFMETVVLPWARQALGPLKGGPDGVTCETCHGARPAERGWQMPAVAALPQSDVLLRGWEQYSSRMDAQMRNAIYGYIAEADNQAKAAYMREIVMPGMARLLRRPSYDFTRSYEYNRTQSAFGCYHCHRVAS